MAVYKELAGYELPDWVTIEIVTVDESKFVIIRSKIHMVKEKKITMSWSTDFTDQVILNDGYVFNFVCTSYGLALVTRLESI
jgi:hypothetical protein